MKILLISGHGAGDSGAVGNGYKEANLTRELVRLIAPKLKEYATVDVYDQTRNAYKDVKNGKFNVSGYDYALEVHFNAYSNPQAHGTEIYVTTNEAGITVEQTIMRKMKKYFTLRDSDGVKKTDFAVIKRLKNKGISGALLETCFITNASEMKIYQASKNAIAQDIVDGIVEGFGLKKIETPKTIEIGSKVTIKNGSVYGGLSSSRGKKVSSYALAKTHTVAEIQTNKGVKEARLKEINSWVAVDFLVLK